MSLVNIVLGAIVLLFGRPLFWAFVAVAGLLLGVEFAQSALAQEPFWVQLLIGVGAGLAGALIAVFAQRIGFAIAGFFSGGYIALLLVQHAEVAGDPHVWMFAGGAAGAILAALLMDWVIIAMSSLVGAAAIVDALDLAPLARLVVFAVSLAVGVGVQSKLMRRSAERASSD